MHAESARNIPDEMVDATLLDEIQKVKQLTKEASVLHVRVHNLPAHPSDVEDDGDFHYVVLGPQAACESGKPSSLAVRYLDETTGSNKPRVFRNALVIACPSKDGMEIARRRIREHLAWLDVQDKLGKKEAGKEVKIDPVRATALMMNVDQAKKRVPEAILQAYCIVVTVSEKNEVQAFKLTLKDDSLFITIKEDERSRIRDTAITAEALLPDGPYDLWKDGEDCRRIKDLVGAFAQMPHLPKMLNVHAIHETLVRGCEEGAFVLRLPRPNRTFRTWWRTRPDDVSLKDAAMEVVLPEKAELSELPFDMLAKDKLPGLWKTEKILVKDAYQYFSGQTMVEIERGGYKEPMLVPKAPPAVIDAAVGDAVTKGLIWLISGPSSILAETVPAGIITSAAELRAPPAAVLATQVLPQALPDAWKDNKTTALSIATVLSQKAGLNLPWVTVREAIAGALQARFMDLDQGSGTWPCDFSGAKAVKLAMAKAGSGRDPVKPVVQETLGVYRTEADLEPSEVQDLGESIPKLLNITAATDTPLRFHIRVEVGSEKKPADKAVVAKVNAELKKLKDGLTLG